MTQIETSQKSAESTPEQPETAQEGPCCPPTKKASCCAPQAKSACCGPAGEGKKGCC